MSDLKVEFEVAGTTYVYTRMSPEKVVDGLALVSPLFKGEVEKALNNTKALLRLFVGNTEILHTDEGTGKEHIVKMGARVTKMFTGKPGEMIAFIMKCVETEYGDFLPGRPGADAVMEVAHPFMSLMDSTGSSGE